MSHATKPRLTLFRALLVVVACHESCVLLSRCSWSGTLPTHLLAWAALLAFVTVGFVRFYRHRAAHAQHEETPTSLKKRVDDG